jgi:hypothetical protein
VTRDELITGIKLGYEGDLFSDLPLELLDSEVVSAWLQYHGNLNQVPRQYVNDDHRRFAVGRSHNHQLVKDYPLAAIKKEDTNCYEELALIALGKCHMNMRHVDPALHREDFFLKALEVNRAAMMPFLSGAANIRTEWSEAVIDSAVSKDARYLHFFSKEQVKQESLERLVTGGENTAKELEDAGLLDLMSDLMRRGYWPQMVKPSSLKEALYFMVDIPQSAENLKIYYKAFVRFHPMEDVLPIMKSPEMQAMMLEIYRTDELMPHLRTGLLKGASKVRGKLLEEGLGL